MIRTTLDRRALDGPNTTVSEGDPEKGETLRVLYQTYHRPRGYDGPVTVIPARKAGQFDVALQRAEQAEIVAEARKAWAEEPKPDPKPIDDKPTNPGGRARQ